ADAACARVVPGVVGVIEETHVHARRVGVGGHDVVGQVAVDGRARAGVVVGLFQQGHAHAHDDRPFDLVARHARVDHAAAVDHRHHAGDAQARGGGVPG